jgi:hypothetical protein
VFRNPLLFALATLALLAGGPSLAAARLRVATYDVGLARDGPGLLLADQRADTLDPDIAAAIAVIQAVRPDILLLNRFDHDLGGAALAAFRARLAAGPEGIDYPHTYAPSQNAGVDSGLDLDGDGRLRGAGDALGWGRFRGQGAMALLSRLPIDAEASHDFRQLRWTDLPGARMPVGADGAPFLAEAAREILPLSSRSHWDVAIILPDGTRLRILASNPTPPLFDGPERLNELRNAAEISFWTRYLDGETFLDAAGIPATRAGPFVLLGNLNTDPRDGVGDHAAIAALLAHPTLTDPRPESAGAEAAAAARDTGAPERDTARLRDFALRLDYALPSRDLTPRGAGVFWPAPGQPGAEAVAAGPSHRLVFVDILAPGAAGGAEAANP